MSGVSIYKGRRSRGQTSWNEICDWRHSIIRMLNFLLRRSVLNHGSEQATYIYCLTEVDVLFVLRVLLTRSFLIVLLHSLFNTTFVARNNFRLCGGKVSLDYSRKEIWTYYCIATHDLLMQITQSVLMYPKLVLIVNEQLHHSVYLGQVLTELFVIQRFRAACMNSPSQPFRLLEILLMTMQYLVRGHTKRHVCPV